MEKFTVITGLAAPFPLANVDTDRIIPARFLKTIKRTGLGAHLFNDIRFNADGSERPDFVLNRPPYREARILVAGANFGCGSSREHAPWALLDFGIRSVVAESFADIFFNNCFKNGILPVALAPDQVGRLMDDARGPDPTLTIDLPAERVRRAGGEAIAFKVDPFRKHCLLNGLDDIGLTLERRTSIDRFEERQRREAPWLWRAPGR